MGLVAVNGPFQVLHAFRQPEPHQKVWNFSGIGVDEIPQEISMATVIPIT
jgi:hypothetical protein